MSEKTTTKTKSCKVCYKPIPEGAPDQYGQSMYYVRAFTCSRECYNRDWVRNEPVGPGWMPIVWATYNKLNKLSDKWRVSQIKEKFGGLRFYVSSVEQIETDKDDNMLGNEDDGPQWTEAGQVIYDAEALSFKTCEMCGEPGVARGGGWVKTLCDDCADGRKPMKDWDNC